MLTQKCKHASCVGSSGSNIDVVTALYFPSLNLHKVIRIYREDVCVCVKDTKVTR